MAANKDYQFTYYLGVDCLGLPVYITHYFKTSV